MSERLEDFIKSRRKEFDSFEPPEELWGKIEHELDRQEEQKKRPRVLKLVPVLRVAAVLLIIATAGIVFFRSRSNDVPDISKIDPDLARKQVQYTLIIEAKQNELLLIKAVEPQLYKEFSDEVTKLEQNYESLKNDLPTSPNREETLKAMIKNLKIQAEMLNQQLNIIQQIQQFKKEQNHEDRNI